MLSTDGGTITWGCATDSLGREWCGEPAEYFAYGMARCATHAVELSPCTWGPNMRAGACNLDHQRRGHIYGVLCRNTRKELTG
ncbi:hypothetical protein [Streptomyces hydrogenans]|uniref:Uncharacterized protein n=1 Tax=Streptomyces hydrogenans TaxID=1873719 RepID=A0ABQ3PJL0_9ACTN|nr:hypothetical protein [Streptomyces hydrogenans]GHG10042.1 hypothetical protein GCM10018784_23390 [Streptomyces hydrogenans]GHI25209.1 hypothetical protein Shyd_65800 [Streptomyces hydrogenans]